MPCATTQTKMTVPIAAPIRNIIGPTAIAAKRITATPAMANMTEPKPVMRLLKNFTISQTT